MDEKVVHGHLRDSNAAFAPLAHESCFRGLLVAGIETVELKVTIIAAEGGGNKTAILASIVLQPGLLHIYTNIMNDGGTPGNKHCSKRR